MQLLTRVRSGLQSGHAADFVFNCQMGRGRTTTGMVTACLIATTTTWEHEREAALQEDEQNANAFETYDSIDGPSEEEAYLQGELGPSSFGCLDWAHAILLAGEYKVILQLVSVLSHGKLAKRLTDRAIDQMQDVQNLRKAIYECVSRSLHTPLETDVLMVVRLCSYKLKVDACEKGSAKQRKLMDIGVNYL